jgi:hypothetical protein
LRFNVQNNRVFAWRLFTDEQDERRTSLAIVAARGIASIDGDLRNRNDRCFGSIWPPMTTLPSVVPAHNW